MIVRKMISTVDEYDDELERTTGVLKLRICYWSTDSPMCSAASGVQIGSDHITVAPWHGCVLVVVVSSVGLQHATQQNRPVHARRRWTGLADGQARARPRPRRR